MKTTQQQRDEWRKARNTYHHADHPTDTEFNELLDDADRCAKLEKGIAKTLKRIDGYRNTELFRVTYVDLRILFNPDLCEEDKP